MKNSPFQYREFNFYILMRLMITIGSQLKSVIIGYYLYSLTKSSLSIGIIGLCEALPFIALALYAGYYVEGKSKQKMMKLVIGGMTINILILAILPLLHYFKYLPTHLTINLLYLTLVLRGFINAFGPPSSVSTLSIIIPKNLMPRAAATSSSAWQIGAVLGPLMGAVLSFFTGDLNVDLIVFYCLIIGFGFHIIAWISVNQIKNTYPDKVLNESPQMILKIKEGLHYVFNNKILLYAISLDLFAVFFGGVTALLPVFASEILHEDISGLSWLRAALPFGSAIMMIYLSKFPPIQKSGYKLLYAVGFYGLCTIAFALSKNFYFSFLMLFMCGIFDSISVVIRATILQLQTPETMKSRVSAVNSMFISSSNELGAAESGFAARLMGTIPSVIFGGSMTVFIVLFTWFKGKDLKESELKMVD